MNRQAAFHMKRLKRKSHFSVQVGVKSANIGSDLTCMISTFNRSSSGCADVDRLQEAAVRFVWQLRRPDDCGTGRTPATDLHSGWRLLQVWLTTSPHFIVNLFLDPKKPTKDWNERLLMYCLFTQIFSGFYSSLSFASWNSCGRKRVQDWRTKK